MATSRILGVPAAHCWLIFASSAILSVSSKPNIVDLSYQHHLGPDTIIRSVEEGVKRTAGPVEIDVSSTLLSDGGCERLAQIFARTRAEEEDDGDGPTEIVLSARMNRITAAGASALLDSLADAGRKTEDDGKKGSEERKEDAPPPPSSSSEEGGESEGAASPDECNRTEADSGEAKDDATMRSESMNQYYISTLDLGLNDLGRHHRADRSAAPSRSFAKSIRTIIEGSPNSVSACPKVLRLDRCNLGPSACRAIGKGLLKSAASSAARVEQPPIQGARARGLECLHLSGNEDIGDSGAAALAAALRTATRREARVPLLEALDLSSCGIGDAGAEALAMAIKDNPGCVKRLDLSHNRITDDGAVAIGRALGPKRGKRRDLKKGGDFVMESVDLSGNKDLGDDGAAALAAALECGALRSVYIRSCSIRSDGAAAFGNALLAYLTSTSQEEDRQEGPFLVNVDLSGNDLGTLRTKKKAKPYSPSLLKSKASATTASYMNFIGKKIKSGLKDAGLMDVSQAMGNFIPSSESDDEEEALMGLDEKDDDKSSAARCGARSFAEVFVGSDGKEPISERLQDDDVQRDIKGVKCIVGMRQTSLDDGAADALAAVTVRGRDKFQIDVSIDAKMNDALGKESISALQGEEEGEVLLRSMAKRHLDAVEALRIARQRAAEAAEAAAARARAEEMMSGAFGGGEHSDFGSLFP